MLKICAEEARGEERGLKEDGFERRGRGPKKRH